MNRIVTLIKIGRSPEMEIHLDDETVSRHHAELAISSSGKFCLTDCQSTSGTFVYRDEHWEDVSQRLVSDTDRISFGDCEMTVSEIIGAVAQLQDGRRDRKSEMPELESDGSMLVRRDPETGEIIFDKK